MRLDRYANAACPVLIEVFAHVGPSKGGLRHEIAHDMTMLPLAERLLGVPCRMTVDAAASAAGINDDSLTDHRCIPRDAASMPAG